MNIYFCCNIRISNLICTATIFFSIQHLKNITKNSRSVTTVDFFDN